jgi:signal transduction histidine kinase
MAVISDRRIPFAAAAAMLLVAAAFFGALGWLHQRTSATHDLEVYELLERELLTRSQIDRDYGREALLSGLRWRLGYLDEGEHAVVIDAAGRVLVGDPARLAGGAASILPGPARRRVELPDGFSAYVATRSLDDGARMIASRVDRRGDDLRRSTGIAAAVAILLAGLVGLAAAVLFNRFVMRRVASIADVARDIMRGQMASRAPEGQRLDALGGLARTFNDMLDQNEALVTGLRTVTESMAHDLRTPLQRISRNIEAARTTLDPGSRERQLASAQADLSLALHTFNALVDLARAEAGLSRESMEEVVLAALATDVCDLFEPVAEERGQRLERRIEACSAVAHRQILSQALGNLLENAIKFSPPGTGLLVAVEAGAPGHGPSLVVQDRGPGVPSALRAQAVRPFVRLETPMRQPGTGMGLAIAAAVARLHRGSLVLDDADPGLRVTLTLGAPRPSDLPTAAATTH